MYFKGFLNYDVFLSPLKVGLDLENSADPDEMQHYAAFHLGLHYLLKFPFGVSSIQRVNAQRCSVPSEQFRIRNCIALQNKEEKNRTLEVCQEEQLPATSPFSYGVSHYCP